MTRISVKIEGLDEALKDLKASPNVIAKEMDMAVKKSILQVENASKKEAPVNKQTGGGNLRQSIRSRIRGFLSGEVSVGAKYGVYVHEGTRPHVINVKNKRGLANRRTGQFFGRRVNHPGTRANPFLTRAVEQSEEKIKGFFETGLQKIIDSI